jgi:tRNA pseudouridine55 synthase
MLGVVNLDKPVGVTSHDMVGLLRRLTGLRRIGHAGTLDPLASGVLPILVGPATRFSEELTGGRKGYDAVVRLGISSATDDAEGPLAPGSEPIPHRAAIESALANFRGEFAQRPPAFSARKQGGETAHRAARAGRPLELASRTVSVDRLELTDLVAGDGWADVWLELDCGPGTYVRSIARDLGAVLGCGGYLHALRRREAAGLHVEDAVRPERLEELAKRAYCAVEGTSYGRVDIRKDCPEGELYVLEVNANPGISGDEEVVSVGRMLALAGMTFADLLGRIIGQIA